MTAPATVRAAIADAARRFAFSATPRLDAELLMAQALGTGREAMLLGRMDERAPAGFAALAARRVGREPVAYITGTRAFWTIDLAVGPGVLVPRADSETLIEAAVAHFAGGAGPARVLDLGTGSGALLFAALDQWPAAHGVGVERSAEAMRYAAANRERLDMAARARLVAGDWTEVAGALGRFDLVLCNPPYVAADAALPDEVARHEPAAALFAGADGLDDYRRLAPLLPALLASGGAACVEIGADQAAAVGELLRAAGLAAAVRRDLAGRDRCLLATA